VEDEKKCGTCAYLAIFGDEICMWNECVNYTSQYIGSSLSRSDCCDDWESREEYKITNRSW